MLNNTDKAPVKSILCSFTLNMTVFSVSRGRVRKVDVARCNFLY